MEDNERMSGMEPSHVARYLLARGHIVNVRTVLDVFCGTGYGAKLMADIAQVTAFDRFNGLRSRKGITYIKAEYPHISFDTQFDMITCFEAIEHVEQELAVKLLADMRTWLKQGGQLFISSPNQLHYPFDKSKIPHHFLHYTPETLKSMLNDAGFVVMRWWNQKAKFTFKIDDGHDGKYMIARCM